MSILVDVEKLHASIKLADIKLRLAAIVLANCFGDDEREPLRHELRCRAIEYARLVDPTPERVSKLEAEVAHFRRFATHKKFCAVNSALRDCDCGLVPS